MDILRKEYDLTTENKAEPRLREDCIDNSLVRENGEEWYDVTNRRCVCQVRKIYKHDQCNVHEMDRHQPPLHLVSQSENCQKHGAPTSWSVVFTIKISAA